ncbi:MAG: hypothetical protein HWN66_10015 [Candidatus Helarchaeota archaeon]|nr:hypothetical protein [Candidatus Helarchaeota archaeon]
MAEKKEYDLRIPPGTPNLEELLSEVIKKFDLKVIAPKDLDEPYYLAVRGDLESVQAAKEYIRKRLEETVAEMEKKRY